jgi:hypothetical protein
MQIRTDIIRSIVQVKGHSGQGQVVKLYGSDLAEGWSHGFEIYAAHPTTSRPVET